MADMLWPQGSNNQHRQAAGTFIRAFVRRGEETAEVQAGGRGEGGGGVCG